MKRNSLTNCKFCGKPFKPHNSSRGIYCSNRCQQDLGIKRKYDQWVNEGVCPYKTPISLKRAIILRDGYKCAECGIRTWNGKGITLELEHKDGNWHNNTSKNVCLNCPNCHSQTPTYRNKNKGNGRALRRKRYIKGLSSEGLGVT